MKKSDRVPGLRVSLVRDGDAGPAVNAVADLVPYNRGSYTDKDRDVHMAAACSRERRFRDVIEGLVEGIDRRISLGQSLLKFHDEQLKRGA